MKRNYVKKFAIDFYVKLFTIILSHDLKKFFFVLIAENLN